jgi:hypothetical protein
MKVEAIDRMLRSKDKMMGSVATLPKVATTPSQPSMADRQVIFHKLADVYLDEKTGYRDGWTDKRVANDLNVPQRWVEIIRNENFGVNASSMELLTSLGESALVATECRELAGKLLRSADEIQRKLDYIQKQLGPA